MLGGHFDVVKLLVSAGADVDSQDNRKVFCLMAAFRKVQNCTMQILHSVLWRPAWLQCFIQCVYVTLTGSREGRKILGRLCDTVSIRHRVYPIHCYNI